jgi:hypothetical protein
MKTKFVLLLGLFFAMANSLFAEENQKTIISFNQEENEKGISIRTSHSEGFSTNGITITKGEALELNFYVRNAQEEDVFFAERSEVEAGWASYSNAKGFLGQIGFGGIAVGQRSGFPRDPDKYIHLRGSKSFGEPLSKISRQIYDVFVLKLDLGKKLKAEMPSEFLEASKIECKLRFFLYFYVVGKPKPIQHDFEKTFTVIFKEDEPSKPK